MDLVKFGLVLEEQSEYRCEKMGKILHLEGTPGVKAPRQTSTECAPAWCKIRGWRTYRKAVLDHMQGYIAIATEQLGSPFGGYQAIRHNQGKKQKKEGLIITCCK